MMGADVVFDGGRDETGQGPAVADRFPDGGRGDVQGVDVQEELGPGPYRLGRPAVLEEPAEPGLMSL